MFRVITVGLLMLLAARAAVAADNKGQMAALRLEVKLLKSQETATVKAIQSLYRTLLGQDTSARAQLVQLRAALGRQERDLLALTTDRTERAQIRQQYALVRKALGAEGKLDGKLIAQLRQQEKVHVQGVRTLYRARIKQLENEMRVLQAAGKATKAAGRR